MLQYILLLVYTPFIYLIHALYICLTQNIHTPYVYTYYIHNNMGFSQQHRSVLGGGEGMGDNTVPVLYVIKGVCILAYVYLA